MAANDQPVDGNRGSGGNGGPPIYRRLAGLETEYAVRFHPDADASGRLAASPRPSDYSLYKQLTAELRRAMPTAPVLGGKRGLFLANGGAVWHEEGKGRRRHQCALVEGSTPECRGPRQLLAHQRAQDELLAAAARDARVPGEFALCKSDRDAHGHVYGAQENYEVTLATGWRLLAWRVGLRLLWPLVALTCLGRFVLFVGVLAFWAVGSALYGPVTAVCGALSGLLPMPHPRAIRELLVAPDGGAAWGEVRPDNLPAWLEPAFHAAQHVVTAPLAVGLNVLANLTVFRRVRRDLLPFLATRAVFTGAGRLARDGSYHVAAKATGVNCVASVNGVFARRPVFSYGHFLKALPITSWRSQLDACRQRLQINLGDSNLCEEAEYLRVGTTMLVLDVIEAGQMPPVPRLRSPLAALRRVATDATLAAPLALSDGRQWTALQVQRFYLEACRAFLARHGDPPAEALDVVRRWADMLDRLEHDPGELVGRVDWVTKRLLLQQCGAGAPWPVRKKIDLRYHELSPEGYFQQLSEAGLTRQVLNGDERDRARRNPPPDSPAAERGRYIREFAGSKSVLANWETVHVGHGAGSRTIHLRRDEPGTAPLAAGRKASLR